MPPWEIGHVKQWADQAKPYDLVINSGCEFAEDESKMLEIIRRTHKP